MAMAAPVSPKEDVSAEVRCVRAVIASRAVVVDDGGGSRERCMYVKDEWVVRECSFAGTRRAGWDADVVVSLSWRSGRISNGSSNSSSCELTFLAE